MQYPWPELANLAPSPASCITTCQSPSVPSLIQQENLGLDYLSTLSEMLVAFNADIPIHLDNTMLSNHNLHEKTITSGNFEEGLLLPNCTQFSDQCCHDHSLVRHAEDANDGGNTNMESLTDMWESWLNTSSQLQPLNNGPFDGSALACRSISPTNFSREMSPHSLLHSNTSTPAATAIPFGNPSPNSSYTPSYVANQHDNLHNLYISNHSKEHLDLNICTLSLADTPPHQLNVGARGSPSLPNLEARPVRTLLPLETEGSMKASGNCSKYLAKESEEAVKLLVETNMPAIDDGYVWLKYGQKRIKDRMHPSSGRSPTSSAECYGKTQPISAKFEGKANPDTCKFREESQLESIRGLLQVCPTELPRQEAHRDLLRHARNCYNHLLWQAQPSPPPNLKLTLRT